MGKQALPRATKRERTAYELILEWIYGKYIPPGTRLSERSIVEELGLSRTPVREAIQRLTLEGMLVNEPGRGTCLREYNEQDILDLYLYREMLDGMATRLFTIRVDTIEVSYLRMICDEMEAMSRDYDARRWDEKDIEFHMIIARGCRNKRILTALGNVLRECVYLWKQFRYSHGTDNGNSPPPHLPAVLEEHKRIVEAIASGDAARAEEVARRSVQDGLERRMRTFVHITKNLVADPDDGND